MRSRIIHSVFHNNTQSVPEEKQRTWERKYRGINKAIINSKAKTLEELISVPK